MASGKQSHSDPQLLVRRLSSDSCDLYADVEHSRPRRVKRHISARRSTGAVYPKITIEHELLRRLSSDSCDLYADVERSRPRRVKRDVLSRRSTGALYSQDTARRERLTPSARFDSPRNSSTNSGTTSDNKPSECEYEVASEATSGTNQIRVYPKRENRSTSNLSKTQRSDSDYSSHREGMGCKISLAKSTTRSKRPKTSKSRDRSKSRKRPARDNSGRSQVSKTTSKSRERLARANSGHSQVTNSRRFLNSPPNSTARSLSNQRSADRTHGSNNSLLSSSESRRLRDSRQSSQQSSAKSAWPSPTQRKPTKQSDSYQVVDRLHIPASLRKPTGMMWSSGMGYVSKSSPTIGTTGKHASSQKHDKSKSDKKEKKDRKDTNKDKPALTTRSWRAQLALRSGRKPQTPNITKS